MTAGPALTGSLDGRVAVVTGAASGIGLALARRLSEAGMRVVLMDVDGSGLAAATADLRAAGGEEPLVIACDVADEGAVVAAAHGVRDRLGRVDLLCSNAGVARYGLFDDTAPADWDWVMDVNLRGGLNMLRAFLPLMRSTGTGTGGHILLTASIASFLSGPGVEGYAASKHALLALGEGLALQLAPEGIGLSILCPHFVRTAIDRSDRHRPARYGDMLPAALADDHPLSRGVRTGLDPDIIARRAIEGMRAGELYIFTHPNARPAVEAYQASVIAAFDRAAASPVLAEVTYWQPLDG